MKTALILPVAFCTTDISNPKREERILQYVAGFKQISELAQKYSKNFDVFVVDSTVSSDMNIDERLQDAMNSIPNLKEKIFFLDNKLGKKNKGAGLIVQWKKALLFLNSHDKYEFCISYEPRQHLNSFSFFERFLARPDNYFLVVSEIGKKYGIVPYSLVQVWTGLLAIRVSDIKKYSHQVSLWWMVLTKSSIERDMYLFIIQNEIPFTEVSSLDITWHDGALDTYITV